MVSKRGKRQSRTHAPTTRQPEPFGSALDELARQLGIKKKLKQFSVITSWPQIVGEQVARATEAERIENGILFVKTATASWRTELTMRRMEILEKINAAAGSNIVKEIRFR